MPGAFTFDPDRCTGCQACELACSIENGLGTDRSWRSVITFNPDGLPGAPRYHLSLACNHCEEPACMHACPALAYSRDSGTGAVLLDPDRCIGCRYCAWACPYGAPTFEEERGVMGKCTFCSHRLSDGLKPACATLCPTGALDFAELPLQERVAEVAGFPQTDLGPSIRITRPRRRSTATGRGGPPGAATTALPSGADRPAPGISLRTEGSLAAFTFLTTLLFALFAAAVGGGWSVPPLLFPVVAAVAAGLSLSHLGRPERAWRAGLNLRRSWLSREVVGFGLFAAGGTAFLVARPGGLVLAGGVLALGLFTLRAADQVYRPVHPGRDPSLDPGGALITGLYLAGLMLGSAWLAVGPWAMKAVGELHAARDAHLRKSVPAWLAWTRVALGLLLPAMAWVGSGAPPSGWIVGLVIAAEALGRAGFYLRLERRSPARQARLDLDRRLRTPAA
jgi:Fe-S-cluster-containing dehydrogenase component/DMSO reductase anchor subunit